jgi:hypothetical protein
MVVAPCSIKPKDPIPWMVCCYMYIEQALYFIFVIFIGKVKFSEPRVKFSEPRVKFSEPRVKFSENKRPTAINK